MKWLPTLLLIMLLAVLSNALWLLEVLFVSGWEGIAWLSLRLHYGALAAALCAVFAYLLPFRTLRNAAWANLGIAALEIYPAALIAFFLAKTLLFSLYTRFYGYLNSNLLLLLLGLVVLLISFSIHFVTKGQLHRVRWGHGFFVAAGIVTVVPLSMLSVQMLPGFGTGITFVDAVKMGYPFFWIVVMMGLLGIRTASWQPESEVEIVENDILDDWRDD